MHDQVGVRVRDRLEHVEEQAEPRLDSELRARRSSGRWAGRRRARARDTAGPPGETPASMRCAMCGWVSRARMLPSRRNRSSPARPISAMFSSLTAARPSKRPSQRSASQTLPMPPWPMRETQPVGAEGLPGQREGQRRALRQRHGAFQEARLVRRPRARRAASAGRRRAPRPARESTPARTPVRRRRSSSASSRYGLTARQRSALSGGMRPHPIGPPSAIARCR